MNSSTRQILGGKNRAVIGKLCKTIDSKYVLLFQLYVLCLHYSVVGALKQPQVMHKPKDMAVFIKTLFTKTDRWISPIVIVD